MYALGSSCLLEKISVAFALLPSFSCASRPVIPEFALYLSCCARHLVLGFPTVLYPVGCEGRIHYTQMKPERTSCRQDHTQEEDIKGSDGAIHEPARSADKVRCAEVERRPLLQGVLK